MEIYLSLELQDAILTSLRVFFVITCLLNALSLFCLVKETPPNQATIRVYLLSIQILLICTNVYMEVLFRNIPVFPAVAGYCLGVLCEAGVSPHTVHAGVILVSWLLGVSIMSCVFYRHQTIIPDDNRFKISKKARWTLQVILIGFLGVTPIAYAAYPFDRDVGRILKENQFNISWIATRGPYFAHERSTLVLTGICIMDSQVFLCIPVVLLMFWHMFYVLRQASSKSRASVRHIRRSLIALFVQIAVPLAMLVLPIVIAFTSGACECISFGYVSCFPAFIFRRSQLMSIYLPLELQETLFATQRVIFIITCIVNVIALFCLLKETPPSQAGIRAHLLFIQILVICSNIYQDILFRHIPVFPAIAGYCVGLLCEAGMSPHAVHAIFILICWLVGTSIMSCVIYRHQSIIPADNSFRISERNRRVAEVIVIVILGLSPVIYAAYPFDYSDFSRILRENPFNITWISSRGPFYIHERSTTVITMICLIDTQVVLSCVGVILLFWHMFHVLRISSGRSRASIKAVRRSLIVLFVQIAVPLAMLVFPVFISFTSMACECIPFGSSRSHGQFRAVSPSTWPQPYLDVDYASVSTEYNIDDDENPE